MGPTLLMWALVSDQGLSGRVEDGAFLAGVVLSSVVSAVMFFGGHRAGLALVGRRRERGVAGLPGRPRARLSHATGVSTTTGISRVVMVA